MATPTDEQRRAWMAQWNSAGPALRRAYLKELVEADLARIAADLEDASLAAAAERARSVTSGLVEQQRLFHRARSG